MQGTNNFTSFTSQAASRWLTCSCWLTWHKTRTYLLKHKEKEKQARKLQDRQEKESAKDANIEQCSGKQVQRVCSTGTRSLATCCEHRRRRLRKRKKVRHSMRTVATTCCRLDCRFPEDHRWFCRLGWLFFSFTFFCFLFFSFSSSLFFFFFFWTRLLTLRNLRYVATRLVVVCPFSWAGPLGLSQSTHFGR